MGAANVAAFDAELAALLRRHAEDEDIAFEVTTRLAWGRPRRTPRP